MKKDFEDLIKQKGAMYLLGNSSCPCGNLELFDVKIDTHCWKSGSCRIHPYSCVHIKAGQDNMIKNAELKAIAKLFADYIKEAYMTEVAVQVLA